MFKKSRLKQLIREEIQKLNENNIDSHEWFLDVKGEFTMLTNKNAMGDWLYVKGSKINFFKKNDDSYNVIAILPKSNLDVASLKYAKSHMNSLIDEIKSNVGMDVKNITFKETKSNITCLFNISDPNLNKFKDYLKKPKNIKFKYKTLDENSSWIAIEPSDFNTACSFGTGVEDEWYTKEQRRYYDKFTNKDDKVIILLNKKLSDNYIKNKTPKEKRNRLYKIYTQIPKISNSINNELNWTPEVIDFFDKDIENEEFKKIIQNSKLNIKKFPDIIENTNIENKFISDFIKLLNKYDLEIIDNKYIKAKYSKVDLSKMGLTSFAGLQWIDK